MSITRVRFSPWYKSIMSGIPFDGYEYSDFEISDYTNGTLYHSADNYIYLTISSSATVALTANVTYTGGLAYKQAVALIRVGSYTIPITNNTSDIEAAKQLYGLDLYPDIAAQLKLYRGTGSMSFVVSSISDFFTALNAAFPDTTETTAYVLLMFQGQSSSSYNITQNLTNCTSDYTSTTVDSATKTTIVYTADDGYFFESANSLTTSAISLTSKTLSDDKTQITVIFTPNADCTFTAVATKPQVFTLDKSLYVSNATVTGADDEIDIGGIFTVNVAPNDGYEFKTTPYLMYTNTSSESVKLEFTDNVITTSISDIDAGGTVYVYAVASKIIYTYNITQDLTNCTSSYTASTITTAQDWSIILGANDGYTFETAPTVTGATIVSQSLSDDKLQYTLVIHATSDVTITAQATAVKTYLEVVISSAIGADVVYPSQVAIGDVLSITATLQEGYYWGDTPYIYYTASGGQYGKAYFTIDGDTATLNWTVPTSVYSKISIHADGTPKTTYEDKYGTINVYHVTIDNLAKFASHRIYYEGTDYSINIVDLGDYVSKLHRVYCNIADESTATMNVMNYTLSEIQVQVPYTDVVTVDCGTVTIDGVNESATDYLGKLRFFLPFIGFQEVPIDVSLNHLLHLYYKINIVTGEAVCYLDIDDTTNYIWDCEASQKILYLSNANKKMSDVEFDSKFLYGFTPFVLYTYYLGENNNTSSDCSIRKQVAMCEGYFQMVDTTAMDTTNMNETERQQIIELLNNGVFYAQEYDDETLI